MKEHVLRYLEEDLGYTLCFHERDFLLGESIPANIEAAINHSRRMIMIISRFVVHTSSSVSSLRHDCKMHFGEQKTSAALRQPKMFLPETLSMLDGF